MVAAGTRRGPHGNSPTCLFSSEFVDTSSTVKLVKVSVTFQADTCMHPLEYKIWFPCVESYTYLYQPKKEQVRTEKSQLMI